MNEHEFKSSALSGWEYWINTPCAHTFCGGSCIGMGCFSTKVSDSMRQKLKTETLKYNKHMNADWVQKLNTGGKPACRRGTKLEDGSIEITYGTGF